MTSKLFSGAATRALLRKTLLGAGWWLVLVGKTSAATFALPDNGDTVVGEIGWVRVGAEETFLDIARRHDLGFEEMKLANPSLDPWLPGEGARVVLPTRFVLPAGPREGVIVNLAEMRLYYFPKRRGKGPGTVVTHPVGIGRVEWETRLGKTEITSKVKSPTWYPPESIRKEHAAKGDPLPRVVPPGPDNPLGDYALRLGFRALLIHGTNDPRGVGMRVSHGCLRMYPEDIVTLHDSVPVGTAVRIVKQGFKTGWRNGTLFLEVHPLAGEFALEEGTELSGATRSIVASTDEETAGQVDWDQVASAAEGMRGIPVVVSASPEVAVDGAETSDADSGWWRLSPRLARNVSIRDVRLLQGEERGAHGRKRVNASGAE